MSDNASKPVIEIEGLCAKIGGKAIFDHLNLTVKRREIIAIIGPSGVGKTTLLRSILMLLRPESGRIKVFGTDITRCDEETAKAVQRRWGVMFQSGALFSSLNVVENVIFALNEESDISHTLMREVALFKIALVGLSKDAAVKFPAELSGGMKKRAAMARAIALDPELVFLDEPTAGLDPKSSDEFDSLVLHLREALNLTFVMITHDLDTLWRVPDRVIFLGEGKVLAACPMHELVKSSHPMIQDYLSTPRSKERRAVKVGEDG